MAEIEGVLGDDIGQATAAPEARWAPIFENMRQQEIGKLFLSMMIPVFGLAVTIFHKIDNPDKTVFGFILLLVFAGGLAIFNGLLLRDTYRWLAGILELLGVVLVFLSIIGLASSLVSGPFRVIPALCAVFVLLPFGIAALPRDEPVLDLEN